MKKINQIYLMSRPKESGFVLIAILTILLVLGTVALTLSKTISKNQTGQGMEASYAAANYISLGGLEWAKNQINQGKNPTITQKSFGQGFLTVTIEPAISLIHSTATIGDTQVTHSMKTPLAANCSTMDFSKTKRAGNQIKFIDFVIQSNCIDTPILDKLQLSWTPVGSIQLIQIKCEQTSLYDSVGAPSGTQIDLSDYTFNIGSNECEIKCSNPIPLGTIFTFSWIFKDGSQITFSVTADNNQGQTGN